MRGLAIGRATGNVYSPFHAQPGCCLLLNSRNCCSGGWTTGVWGGGGFYRLQWTIPASTAIPGQLLRFDGALDNLPGSCCCSHESTDLIRPGMVPGTLCTSCNTQCKLCAQGGLRVSWGMSERFSTIFINTRTTQGLGYFIRKGYWASKRVLWPTDIGPIPEGVRSHCWDSPPPLPCPSTNLTREQFHEKSALSWTGKRRAEIKQSLLTFLGLHSKLNSYGLDFSRATCT